VEKYQYIDIRKIRKRFFSQLKNCTDYDAFKFSCESEKKPGRKTPSEKE
jgi:hypothetical protein